MGNEVCCCCAEEALPADIYQAPAPTIRAAIKYPQGARGIDLESKAEVNIDAWLAATTGHVRAWPYYVAYNDEEEGRAVSGTAAHAKGILAWDGAPNGRLAWLCHSVPKYPMSGRANLLPPIENSELIYAQSFCFIEVAANPGLVDQSLAQLALMRVHVTEIRGFIAPQVTSQVQRAALTRLALAPGVVHIAKSPAAQLDIYEALPGARPWLVKSWLRGHEIGDTPGCRDIQELRLGTAHWTRGQDHSKWGVSAQGTQFFIGDLNRMKSQLGRGGGGFLIDSATISRTLADAIV